MRTSLVYHHHHYHRHRLLQIFLFLFLSSLTPPTHALETITSPSPSPSDILPTIHPIAHSSTSTTIPLTLTPTTRPPNALQSEWDKVTEWLSGSESSDAGLVILPRMGMWVLIGVWMLLVGIGVGVGGLI